MSLRASAHTGVAISRIFKHFSLLFQHYLLYFGDHQKVNCPKGKRGHPGVHQSEDWFAMTCVFLNNNSPEPTVPGCLCMKISS